MNFPEVDQWSIVSEDLHFTVPDSSPASEAWKRFALSLHSKVTRWEEEQKDKYRHRVWDFCLIHSFDAGSAEIAEDFTQVLHTIGLTGTKLGDLGPGEDKLEAAESLVRGSTKVFIIVTPGLSEPGIPKFAFHEVLMQKLTNRDGSWRTKIIPVFPPVKPLSPIHVQRTPPSYLTQKSNYLDHRLTPTSQRSNPLDLDQLMEDSVSTRHSTYSDISSTSRYTNKTTSLLPVSPIQVNIPFGLAKIEGIHMVSPSEICDRVHKCMSVSQISSVQRRRKEAQDIYNARLASHRRRAFQQISQVLQRLSEEYSTIGNPADILDEITFQLSNLDGCPDNSFTALDTNQIIKVINCTNVSMGTSINFSINNNN